MLFNFFAWNLILNRITWPYWADGGKQTLDKESKDSQTGKKRKISSLTLRNYDEMYE